MSKVVRMDAGEFRRLGLLQELNRQFLHPLGLALEIVCSNEDKVAKVGLEDALANLVDAMHDKSDDPPKLSVTVMREFLEAYHYAPRFGGVWDYRDDPEGIIFDPKDLNPKFAEYVESLRRAHVEGRAKYCGHGMIVQPVKDWSVGTITVQGGAGSIPAEALIGAVVKDTDGNELGRIRGGAMQPDGVLMVEVLR